MCIKMIVTDLDGTLLRTDKTISDYTLSVFKQCREKGIKIVIATARPLFGIADFTKVLENDGLIVTNGAFIYANDNIIHENVLPKEKSNTLLVELNQSPEVLKIGARKPNVYYTTKTTYEWDVLYDFSKPLDIDIAHISFRTEDTVFADNLIKKYSDFDIYRVTGENLYNVGVKGCTKANGVKILSAKMGIDLSCTAAFGDDYNDVEMLNNCGIGVAVDNAIEEVRAAADYICDSNDNDGVAKWLEKHIISGSL